MPDDNRRSDLPRNMNFGMIIMLAKAIVDGQLKPSTD
jgi:hypothetical protein